MHIGAEINPISLVNVFLRPYVQELFRHASRAGRPAGVRVPAYPNGMTLSVVSALARLDLDPYREAARLAAMPRWRKTSRRTLRRPTRGKASRKASSRTPVWEFRRSGAPGDGALFLGHEPGNR